MCTSDILPATVKIAADGNLMSQLTENARSTFCHQLYYSPQTTASSVTVNLPVLALSIKALTACVKSCLRACKNSR